MTAVDLTKKLKHYKSGWVALNSKNDVIAHAKTFSDIEKAVKSKKESVTLIPASSNYFGFITSHG